MRRSLTDEAPVLTLNATCIRGPLQPVGLRNGRDRGSRLRARGVDPRPWFFALAPSRHPFLDCLGVRHFAT